MTNKPADITSYLDCLNRRQLVRFITCGNVDDGKSTLIGRLLFDSKALFSDQLDTLAKESLQHGTTGEDMDLALLMDGLQAEREQGITIDVAYRYFSTENRRFIIADSPGHEQYTRNMVTAASTADVAVILIDAQHGVKMQTKRHSYLAQLMEIKQTIVAINKMDLIDYDEKTFDRIKQDYLTFVKNTHQVEPIFIPISALKGDNIVDKSIQMKWYQGKALLPTLNEIKITKQSEKKFYFPVQYVNRPNANFRGYCGTILNGSIQVGDPITVFPSMQHSQVKQIIGPTIQQETADKKEASEPMAITLVLEDEIDIIRGDLITKKQSQPLHTSELIMITLIGMSETPIIPEKDYYVKHTTNLTLGKITKIKHLINVNNLETFKQDRIELNQIAECVLWLKSPIAYEKYADLKSMGSLILIDKHTNATVAAGLIRGKGDSEATHKRASTLHRQDSSNVVWYKHNITQAARSKQKHQQPLLLWFTGLSGSGKSTIANALDIELNKQNKHTFLIDGDNLRHGLNRDLQFGEKDRLENIRRAGEVASLLLEAGLIVIAAFISPFSQDRRIIKQIIRPGQYIEIHVDTPLEICEQRDPKKLYAKARRGEIKNFTGIDSPYEAPTTPDIHIHNARNTVEESVAQVIEFLKQYGI